MNKKLTLILLFIMSINFTFAFEPVHNEKRDLQNVFDFRLFDNYETQIKIFTHERVMESDVIRLAILFDVRGNSYVNKVIQLINCILEPTVDQYKYHQDIIWLLREALAKRKKYQHSNDIVVQELNHFIDDLCEWMYTGVMINEQLEEFLFNEVVLQFNGVDSSHKFSHSMDEIFNITLLDTRFNSDESRKGIIDDSHLFGDFPFYLYTLDNAKRTKMIRTTGVVRDLELDPNNGLPIKVKVCEEFEGYLQALNNKGKKHLYVNLMSRLDHHESIKSHAIENLEKNETFGSSIYVVSLEKAKTHTFYMQSNEYEDQSDAETFKLTFFDLLFQENGYYYLSSHLDRNELKQRISKAIQDIHETYFDSREQLTVTERQDFIEIGYLRIIEIVVDMSEVDYMNTTCRFSLDRGPSIFALLYLDHVIRHAENPTPHYKRFLAYVFAPPLLVHNRPSHTYRIKRIQSAGERLLTPKQ